jgi:hypothetical protein
MPDYKRFLTCYNLQRSAEARGKYNSCRWVKIHGDMPGQKETQDKEDFVSILDKLSVK